MLIGCANNMRNLHKNKENTFRNPDGLIINYEKIGVGSKHIVLIHGFGASLSSWEDIKNTLVDDQYTLLLIDLLGHGLSSKPDNYQYTMNQQAEIIYDMLISLSIKDAVVIGHSYGGSVALVLGGLSETNHANLISKLILIDTAAYRTDYPFFITYLRTPILNNAILYLLPAKYRARHTLNRLFYDKSKISDRIVERYARNLSYDGINYSLIQSAKNILPSNYEQLINSYKQLSTKTLILWGSNDPIISNDIGKRLHKDIEKSIYLEVESCGHIPQEECPEITSKIIRDYLEGN